MDAGWQMNPTLSLPDALLSVVDALPFGVLWVDSELKVAAINAYLRQRLPAVPHQGPFDLERILGRDGPRALFAFRQALHDGQPLTLSARLHREVFCLSPLPGMPFSQIPQLVTILPAQADKRVVGLLVLVQDVSDRVMAEEALKHEIEKLTFMHELDLALNTLELDACMQTLVKRLRALFKADFASLMVTRRGRLEIMAADGLDLSETARSMDLSAGITGWVAAHGQAVNVPRVQQDPRYFPLVESIRSEMAAPLLVKDQCLGVINLESSLPGAFSDDDLKLLEMAAFSAARAMHNAQVHIQSDEWRSYYQAVVNHTGDVIYTVDCDLRLTGANAAWDEFALQNGGEGWISANLAGRSLLEAFSPKEQEKWRVICASLLSGETPSYNEQIPCHAPGKERWLALRAAPLRGAPGSILGLIFSTHDVTRHILAERRLRAANTQYEVLLYISQLLSQNLPNQNVPQVAVETLAEMLQADVVTINQYDEGEQAYRVLAAYGASERHVREFRSPLEQAGRFVDQYGGVGAVYDLQNSIESVNQPIYQEDHLHGVLYAMVEHQGRAIGSLSLFTRDPERRFSREEQDLLRALAPQIGLALENARLYGQLQNLATTDGLTGLVNRRQLDDLLTTEASRSRRYHREFSLMMIDLDHFKCYNDTFGHGLGDELLVEIARLFKSRLRLGDIAARYGGDEFVVVLPETGLKGAVCIAERLRQAVSEIEVPYHEGASCQRLSLSIGIAAYPEHAGEVAELLRCADQALYRAKHLGRDRVEIWSND